MRWGIYNMKRKLIYISGSEVFDLDDIRDTFNQVRKDLKLGSDTILFGIPVDEVNKDINSATDKDYVSDVTTAVSAPQDNRIDMVVEPILDTPPEFIESNTENAQDAESTQVLEQDDADLQPVLLETSDEADNDVVPILSVLGTGIKNVVAPQADAQDVVLDVQSDDVVFETSDTNYDDEQVEMLNTNENNVQNDILNEIITDEIPNDNAEQSLEQLLESMTPLEQDDILTSDSLVTSSLNANDIIFNDDTDATLEYMANEFSHTSLPPEQKTENRGKIGKLKNILPFHKKKDSTSGMISDLFGWADVAANDDDFNMPGFFSNAAKK